MKQLLIFLVAGLIALSGGAVQSPAAPAAQATAEASYQVLVTDGEGRPLAGVMVQLCTEVFCQVFQTDEAGQVHYTGAPYTYQVHLLRAPQGYQTPAEAFTLPAQGGSLSIPLARE